MGKIYDIICRYAEAKDPVDGFGPWLLSERDSSEKEEALSGLWSRLEATPAADNAFLRRSKLSALMKHIPREKTVSSDCRWVWMLPVAAAAALGFLLLLPHTGESPSHIPDQPMAQVVEEVSVVPETSHSPSSSAAIIEDGRSEPLVPINRVVVESEEPHVSESDRESPSSELSSEVSADDPLTDSKEDKDVVAAQWAALERQDRLEGQKKNRPLSLGLQASGGLLASASSRSITLTPVQVIGLGGNWEVSGSQYVEYLPEGKMTEMTEMTEKTRHDVPFRAGVSIFLPLNERFSYGTGLTFTLLHFSSSFSSSSSSVIMSKDARYRCLGVPLMVRYQLSSGDWGSLYGTTGVEADYLLKGWSTVRISEIKDPIVTTFSKQPLLFSARFGAGYEYFIFRRWSIYAEASLDYYFKNNSTFDSFFMKQSLSPVVTLGIHYTLSR